MTRGGRDTSGHIVQFLIPEVFLLEAFLTGGHTISA